MSRDKVDKLYRTLKGLFTIVKIVKNVLGVGLKVALQVVSKLLGVSVNSVLDLTAVLGDGIVQFEKFGNVSGVVAKGVDLVGCGIIKKKKTQWYDAQDDGNRWALGAQYWRENKTEGYDPRYGIILDMVGGQGDKY